MATVEQQQNYTLQVQGKKKSVAPRRYVIPIQCEHTRSNGCIVAIRKAAMIVVECRRTSEVQKSSRGGLITTRLRGHQRAAPEMQFFLPFCLRLQKQMTDGSVRPCKERRGNLSPLPPLKYVHIDGRGGVQSE